jgi:hypothetical protein
MEQVKEMVKACKECQMVKCINNIRSNLEDLKNILICDLFYKVALDIAKSFPKIERGNKYILVIIDHYSKWSETKVVLDHIATTIVAFFEEDFICEYGVLKHVFTDNAGEWSIEFDYLFKVYSIHHQCIAPQSLLQKHGFYTTNIMSKMTI